MINIEKVKTNCVWQILSHSFAKLVTMFSHEDHHEVTKALRGCLYLVDLFVFIIMAKPFCKQFYCGKRKSIKMPKIKNQWHKEFELFSINFPTIDKRVLHASKQIFKIFQQHTNKTQTQNYYWQSYEFGNNIYNAKSRDLETKSEY